MDQFKDENLKKKFRHHWIPGNLPLHSECEVCEEVCGDGPGIVDLRCCWCQRYVETYLLYKKIFKKCIYICIYTSLEFLIVYAY